MSTQNSNPGSPAEPADQPPATSPPQGSTPAVPSPPAPQTFSGTWFQQDDPQILIQWSLQPAQAPGSSSTPDPSSGSTYTAQVRIYQLIFDTVFPSPRQTGPVVPFSVTDPAVGTTPYLQGSFMLLPAVPSLEVMNLRFPGFQPQNITLFSPPTDPGTGGASSLTAPAADDEDTQA